jgi:esterase/lipase
MHFYRSGEDDVKDGLTRRTLLSGLALGAVPLRARGSEAPPAPAARRLFAQPDLDFLASFALGATSYGSAEAGEVLAAIDRINAAGAAYQTYFDEFIALARRLSAEGDAALRAGHKETARAASLRAAHYYKQALFVVFGTSTPGDGARVYGAMQAQWHRAAGLFDPPFERVEIPYEGTTLPAYFLKPDRSQRRRPTVILNNGSDAQNIDLWAYGGATALARGYNALIFEGPGQGAMYFERHVVFRPDWEKVITPVVDALVARPDVDPKRIAITGWSMGGGLVLRAAAFEHRLAAVVADPGIDESWASFPEILHRVAGAGDSDAVNRIWRTQIINDLKPVERFTIMNKISIFSRKFEEAARAGRVGDDFYDAAKAIQQFRFADALDRVTAPLLITSYENEHTNPPGTAEKVFARAKEPKKMIRFLAADGAGDHDAPLAPQRRNNAIFDWLDETLRPPKTR